MKHNRLVHIKLFHGILVMIVGLTGSCKRFLEITPQDRVSDAVVWSNPDVADLFLNDIYAQLPEFRTGHRTTETWTDNCMNNQTWQVPSEIVRSGAYNPTNYVWTDPRWYSTSEWDWALNFSYIRKCNVFIANVAASAELDDDYKKERIAEARFLRAWYYTYLFNFFGGVPIITAPQDPNDSSTLNVARATVEQTADFISSECAEAAADLPLQQTESGRPTKSAALALKGFVELVNASPLDNPGNDPAKWAKAAASYRQVIDLGIHELVPEFKNIFLEDFNGNSENIFYRATRFPRSDYNYNQLERYLEDTWGPAYVEIDGSLTNISIATAAPTQDLIDAYRMEDGRTITESSLYDPEHPYENREKRFYESIIYDGASWKNTIITTRKGGNNPVDRTRTQWITITGYYIKKTLDERINGLLDRPNGRKNRMNWPLMRYAEILLGYAEAQNEAVGPDGTVYDAVNRIRTRGGLPTIQDTYGAVGQDKMREIIRTERRIELAFEGRRFYDLLRWRIAETKLNGKIRGVEIEDVSGTLEYNYFDVATQVFHPERNYRFPIPQYVMELNPKLVQNPGY